GVLPSTSPLARSPFGCTSRGSLSRSVFLSRGCFPVPQGTYECYCYCQDIECCIHISIQDDATTGTDVGTNTERLLHHGPTCATCLAGIVWWNAYNRNSMSCPIVLHPGEETSPSRIVNTLGKVSIPHHIAYL